MADVIAIYFGQCYCQFMWKMLNHMHLTFATSVMAGIIAWWHMEWPVQGDLWQMLFAMGQDVILVLVWRC